jgi:predicted RNase H-like HicB family nuclease
LKYAVLIEKTDSGYRAHIPDLTGCVAAGSTLEETIELMSGALRMHLDGMAADGEPIPEPRTIAEYDRRSLIVLSEV